MKRMLIALAKLVLKLDARARRKLITAMRAYEDPPADPVAGLYHDEAFEDSERR